MKLLKEDIPKIRTALLAARLAGLEDVVFFNGTVSGINASHNGVIFSPCKLSIDENITIGIKNLSDLEKRLSLFGDDIVIEGEVTDANKTRKLIVKAKAGKIDFRCTDEKLIKYPKEVDANPEIAVSKLTKAEVSLIIKAIKVMNTDQVTIQLKKDGVVHIECINSNNDRFETDLTDLAEFISDPVGSVNSYQAGSNGVFLPMLENAIKDAESIDLVLTESGHISLNCYGHNLTALPKID